MVDQSCEFEFFHSVLLKPHNLEPSLTSLPLHIHLFRIKFEASRDNAYSAMPCHNGQAFKHFVEVTF